MKILIEEYGQILITGIGLIALASIATAMAPEFVTFLTDFIDAI